MKQKLTEKEKIVLKSVPATNFVTTNYITAEVKKLNVPRLTNHRTMLTILENLSKQELVISFTLPSDKNYKQRLWRKQ